MVNYKYKAIDATGRQVSGEMTAQSTSQVEQKLQQQRLVPVYVITSKAGESAAPKEASGPAITMPKFNFGGQRRKKIALDEVCDLMRAMAVMSNSGVSLIDSLDTLSASAANPAMCDLVKSIKAEVLGGKTLARAMQAQGTAFPEIASEMVAVADEGGQLGKALQTTTDYLETQSATRKAIIGALVYPGLLMCMSLCTITGFMLFILPTFGKTFEGMNVKLPAITAVMLQIGTYVQTNTLTVLIGLVVTVAVVTQVVRIKTVKKFLRQAFYYSPIAGKVARSFALARSSATLASLTGTSIPIIRALEYAARVSQEDNLTAGYIAVARSVENGNTLADSMTEHSCFPPMMIQLVSVGERSGRLAELVAVASAQIQAQAERRMKAALTVLEPVMIMVMGVVIGGLTLSILIPLFSLQQNIK